jgi:hypothetical protein
MENMGNEGLPYHTVKRLLKQYIKRDVTHDGVIYVKRVLDDLLQQLCEESDRELKEINIVRKGGNLRETKRIGQSIFKNVLQRVLKHITDFKHEERGQHNRETLFSQAIEVT